MVTKQELIDNGWYYGIIDDVAVFDEQLNLVPESIPEDRRLTLPNALIASIEATLGAGLTSRFIKPATTGIKDAFTKRGVTKVTKPSEGVTKVTAKGVEVTPPDARVELTDTMIWEMTDNFVARNGGNRLKIFNTIKKHKGDRKYIDEFLADPKTKELSFAGKLKKNWKLIAAIGIPGATSVLGADFIVHWMMNDNIPYLAQKNAEQLVWNMRNGHYKTVSEYQIALSQMQISADALAAARKKNENIWNPFLTPYKENYALNVDLADAVLANSILEAEGFIEKAKMTEERAGRSAIGKTQDVATEGEIFEGAVERLEGLEGEELLQNQQSFERSLLGQEEGLRQKQIAADIKRREDEAGARRKDRASIGVQGLTRTPKIQELQRRRSNLR